MQVEDKKQYYGMLKQAIHMVVGGWESTVAIAMCYGLDAPWIKFPWR